jgi:hypothetical protein
MAAPRSPAVLSAATRITPQQRYKRDYARGYQQGYRAGHTDAESGSGNAKIIIPVLTKSAAWNKGFEAGYKAGYAAGKRPTPVPLTPAAPSNLTVTGPATAKWRDNSDNEEGFKIAAIATEWSSPGPWVTLPANTTTYTFNPGPIVIVRTCVTVLAYVIDRDTGSEIDSEGVTACHDGP